jgi:AraC-like DNA-binding protein
MDYVELPPPPGLRHLVKLGWSLSVDGPPSASVRHVVTPDGCMEIIRRLRGRSIWGVEQPECFVAGLTTAPFELELGGGSSFIALRLWPWAWNSLGAVAAPALVGRWMDLEEAAPGLRLPASIDAMMRLVRPDLLDPDMIPIVQAIQASRSVRELVGRSGLSHRTLQRWFERNVGVPPRHYLRLLRFQEALVDLQGKEGRLSDHAAEHGYADQAHMAREFRAKAGTPARSARLQAKGPFL